MITNNGSMMYITESTKTNTNNYRYLSLKIHLVHYTKFVLPYSCNCLFKHKLIQFVFPTGI